MPDCDGCDDKNNVLFLPQCRFFIDHDRHTYVIYVILSKSQKAIHIHIDSVVVEWLESIAKMGTVQSPSLEEYTQHSTSPDAKLMRLVAGMAPNPLRTCTEKQRKLYTAYLVGRMDASDTVMSSTGHSVTTGKQSALVTRKDVAVMMGMTTNQVKEELSTIRSKVLETILEDAGRKSRT